MLDGGDLNLAPAMAVTLGMAFHELATNAAKYGALSCGTEGRPVSWRPSPAGGLQLEWQEMNGPRVSPPQRRGYGSVLIETVPAGWDGEVRLRFQEQGVRCEMDIAFQHPRPQGLEQEIGPARPRT